MDIVLQYFSIYAYICWHGIFLFLMNRQIFIFECMNRCIKSLYYSFKPRMKSNIWVLSVIDLNRSYKHDMLSVWQLLLCFVAVVVVDKIDFLQPTFQFTSTNFVFLFFTNTPTNYILTAGFVQLMVLTTIMLIEQGGPDYMLSQITRIIVLIYIWLVFIQKYKKQLPLSLSI